MANTTIKITQLPNIGNGLAANTLLPVVNTTGTAITEKVTVGNVANFILTEAGNSLPAAFVSQIAYNVTNAAQPNITSVGTLTGLSIDDVANLNIPGGTNGQYLQTDGAGNLTWVTGTGSGNGTPGGANSQLQFNLSGNFAGDPELTWDAGNNQLNTVNFAASHATIYGNLDVVDVNATGNLVPNAIYTDHYYYANGYVFGGGGGNGVPGGSNTQVQFNDNGVFGGNAGFIFNKTTGIFTSPFLAGDGNGLSNIQGANVSGAVGLATYAGTANSVAGANVSGAVSYAGTANSVAVGNVVGIGNIATLALDGNSSNVLYGNGVFAAAPGGNPFNQDLNTTDNVTFANITSTDVIKFSNSGNIVGAMGYAPNYVSIEGYGSNSVNITANDIYTWTFDGNGNLTIPNGGNINFVNTGGITQAVNEDLRFTVSDNEEDGWAIQSTVNDGAGNDLTRMQVRYDGVRINTDIPNNSYYWSFRDTGEFDVPGPIRGPVGGNLVIQCGDASGSNTFIDIQTRSHVGDALISNIRLANPDVTISTSSGAYNWAFGGDGAVTFPTLTVDLHNGGNQQAQTLQFGDPTQQAIITGPTPSANINAQRLIIQGQRGNGTYSEGGDVYFWAGDADTNGGDIKIYAGDADNVSAGYGGYINLDGGSGYDGGGQITVTGGYSANGPGGTVYVTAGNGADAGDLNLAGGQSSTAGNDGGNANLSGGYGQNNGGAVTITGGQSALGLANYGNVRVESGASAWTFDNGGNLTVPGEGIIQSINDTVILRSVDANSNIYSARLGTDGGLYFETTAYPYGWLSLTNNSGNANISSPTGSINIDSANGTGGGAGKSINITAGDADQTDYYTTAGGEINIQGGMGAFNDGGGGGPGGNINLVAGTSADPAGVAGNINITSGTKDWTFDNTGNLSAPGYINFSNGSTALITYGANNYINLNNDYGIDVSCNTEVKITTNYGDAPNRAYSYFYANGTFQAAGNITTTGNITATNIGNVAALNLDGSSSNVLYGNGVFAAAASGSSSNISNGNSNVNIATANGNVTIAAVGNSVMTITGTGANITGTANISGNANVGNLGVAAVVATANISTTGYFISGNQATGGFQLGNSNSRLKSGDSNSYMTMGQNPSIFPDTAASALSGVVFGGYGYLLGNNGSRCITLNYGGSSGVVGLQANVQVGSAGSGTVLVPGTVTTGVNSVLAGPTFTPLANTMAGFVSNVNYYTQLTIQNKNTGADATSDFVATADNGSDTVNYLDMGIINSGYDANTPTNSLGNIVFAADSYMYAQGNTGNASQSGGNLAIGTTIAGKNVKIFAGGVDNTAIIANIANTGVTITGNLSVSGNISGNTNGYSIGYLNIPQVSASNTTLALGDAGKHYYSTTAGNITLTVPLNSSVAFPTGTAISIVVQAAGNILVNAASGVTLYMAGSSTAGNRTVGTYGMATLMKVASDTWFINGTGVY